MTRPLAFLDTETDGLGWSRRAWEYGLVLVEYDAWGGVPLRDGPLVTNYVWHVSDFIPDERSSQDALRIGRFHDRFGSEPEGVEFEMASLRSVMRDLDELLTDAQIIGSAPWFDTHIIERDMLSHTRYVGGGEEEQMEPRWYHRMRDIGSVGSGYFRDNSVGGLDDVAERLGEAVEPSLRHTAIGDAALTKACWEAMMGPIR